MNGFLQDGYERYVKALRAELECHTKRITVELNDESDDKK
jgi:hypothetical protein